MMKFNSDLLNLLKTQKSARERKNKNRAIAWVLREKYRSLREIPNQQLAKYLREANSLDREWRKILEEKPDLRGSDYGEKKKLVDKKLNELGYGNQ